MSGATDRAWDIVLFNIPYFAWIYTGDQTIMRECAANMLRYINYITTRRDENGLIHIGLGATGARPRAMIAT